MTINDPPDRDLQGKMTLRVKSPSNISVSKLPIKAFKLIGGVPSLYCLGTSFSIVEPGHSGDGIHDWHHGTQDFGICATAPFEEFKRLGCEKIILEAEVAPVQGNIIKTSLITVNIVNLNLSIYNGGSSLGNQAGNEPLSCSKFGVYGSKVEDWKKNTTGAYLLVNWDDDGGMGKMNEDGAWTHDPVPNLTKTSATDEDNFAYLSLDFNPLPPKGIVTLQVTSGAEHIKLWKDCFKNKYSQNELQSKTTWDLANAESREKFMKILQGGIFIEGMSESQNERDVQFVFSLDIDNKRIARDTAFATVVMINLGNAVYRDNALIGFSSRGHAALVTGFDGPCDIANLMNNSRFTITEMAGPTNNKKLSTMTDLTCYGCFSNPNITFIQRLKILKTAHALASRAIPYCALSALLPKKWGEENWKGKLNEVQELRCDGLVELCYEINGVDVWGKFRTPIQKTIYSIVDPRDEYAYGTILGGYSEGANKKSDALEEHNDVDWIDWGNTLQPATQCGYYKNKTNTSGTDTRFIKRRLCVPVGSKGGN